MYRDPYHFATGLANIAIVNRYIGSDKAIADLPLFNGNVSCFYSNIRSPYSTDVESNSP